MRCIWGHRARKIYYRRRKSEDLFQPSSQLVSLPTPLPRAVASGTWEKNYNKTAAKKNASMESLQFLFSLSGSLFLHHPYSMYEHSLIMMQLARLWLQNDTVCARRPFLRSFFWDLDKSLVHISVECSFVFRPLFGSSSCCNCTLFSHHKFHRKNTHITTETRAQRLSVGSTLWSPSSCYLTWAAQKEVIRVVFTPDLFSLACLLPYNKCPRQENFTLTRE